MLWLVLAFFTLLLDLVYKLQRSLSGGPSPNWKMGSDPIISYLVHPGLKLQVLFIMDFLGCLWSSGDKLWDNVEAINTPFFFQKWCFNGQNLSRFSQFSNLPFPYVHSEGPSSIALLVNRYLKFKRFTTGKGWNKSCLVDRNKSPGCFSETFNSRNFNGTIFSRLDKWVSSLLRLSICSHTGGRRSL